MLTKRIIACLDVDDGRVVKGVQFVNLRDAGDPAELAKAHAASGADEIVLLDISAAHQRRATLLDTVRRAAAELFIPFTVGGGIRTPRGCRSSIRRGSRQDQHQFRRVRGSNPDHTDRRALRLAGRGRCDRCQARAKARNVGKPSRQGGRTATGRDAVEWAREAESRGAGEILLTSMDRDGTGAGFDCDLTRAVADSVRIPVIASGGAGGAQHFVEVFRDGHADAALAASIFHYGFSRTRRTQAGTRSQNRFP